MNSPEFISSVLKAMKIPYTRTFVKELCENAQHQGDLFGIARTLSVFGVKYHAYKVESEEDFKALDLPFIIPEKDSGFKLVTKHEDASMADIALCLSADADAGERDYKNHLIQEIYHNLLWALPVLWLLWMAVSQFFKPSAHTAIGGIGLRLALTAVSALGLACGVLLHRQWTGEGDAVDRICSHFKSSNCSAVHDSFFFSRWFDLSEIGASFFLAVLITLVAIPQQSGALALVFILALPFTLWSIGYQLRHKSWCPLCLSVMALLWVSAIICVCCGVYHGVAFSLADFIGFCLLWGTMLALTVNVVTASVRQKQKTSLANRRLAFLKEREEVQNLLKADFASGPHEIVLAMSPTCPHCKIALEKIETVLMPTGRFSLEKVYTEIHDGDKAKIEALLGAEEAKKQEIWCKEHGVIATPTVFVDGKEFSPLFSIEDLLYL